MEPVRLISSLTVTNQELNKKIINRFGEQGKQGKKKSDSRIGCRN